MRDGDKTVLCVRNNTTKPRFEDHNLSHSIKLETLGSQFIVAHVEELEAPTCVSLTQTTFLPMRIAEGVNEDACFKFHDPA